MNEQSVPTYADIALDWWSRPGGQPHTIIRRKAAHHPEHDCIVCADGRVALGMHPLKPLFARRTVADFHR